MALLNCSYHTLQLASAGFGDRFEPRISDIFHGVSWIDGRHLDYGPGLGTIGFLSVLLEISNWFR